MAAEQNHHETTLSDLPEACLAYAIALTSPRDACRCAAVSPAFRAAADSDHVWQRFIPEHLDQRAASDRPAKGMMRRKDAYLDLCHGGGVAVDGDDGGCRVWLDKASGAKCFALSARRLSLPWDDGEHSWKWTPHPRSRFEEVAELVDCMCLDIYARLPTVELTPTKNYAVYLVYDTAERHRGLSYPDQETTVAVGGHVLERHNVCLRPDEVEKRQFRAHGREQEKLRGPMRRDDGWWEMEMGRLRTTNALGEEEDVVASFEIFGWYAKHGLMLERVEFRTVHC